MLIDIHESTLKTIIYHLRNKGFYTVEERDKVFRIADALEKCTEEDNY